MENDPEMLGEHPSLRIFIYLLFLPSSGFLLSMESYLERAKE